MSTESIARRAGIPVEFSFRGRTYRVGAASPRQHYELMEAVKKHVPHPVKEAARLLKEIGDDLTPAERQAILKQAQQDAQPRYEAKIRVQWDAEDTTPIGEAARREGARLEPGDLEPLGLTPADPIGHLARRAYRRGIRPEGEEGREDLAPHEARIRDLLDTAFADGGTEITEQVGGWPPPLGSKEAYMVLYFGPGLPDVMEIMLPPYNEGLAREQARQVGEDMAADTSGEGVRAFLEAFETPEEAAQEPPDGGDKSDPVQQVGPG